MASEMAFLFLDECSYELLDLAALTGVLIPLHSYNAVRDEMCQISWDVQRPPPNTVLAPLELHARDLLGELTNADREQLDRDRLNVWSTIVNIINNHQLKIFRIAYLNRAEIAQIMKGDHQLYSLNFFGIQAALQDILADTIILPVMDGVPGCAPNAKRPPSINPQLIRAFAQQVRWIHNTRRHNAIASSISITNVENLAEPVFADSTHSTLLQLTDLISHLLLQLERNELEQSDSISEYKLKILKIANSLDSTLLRCWKGRMRIGRPT